MTATTVTQKLKVTTSLDVGDDDDDDDDDAGKHQTAPIELLSEFLSALMLRDYEAAFLHCETILQYEPENQTAVEFFPLLQQRINEAEEDDDSLDDQEMESSRTSDDDDDNSWASGSSTSSGDEYSTASNTLWTTSAVTDLDSPDKDEDVTEPLDSASEGDTTTDDVLNAALNQVTGSLI